MHQINPTAPRPRRLAFLALVSALLLLALAQAAPVMAASTYFDGGAVAADTATMVANDHTVYAFRFANTAGGTYPIPDGDYYVKVRFTPNGDGSPAGVDNRGFTWNGASSTWVQERADWTFFPTVTVTGGLVTGGSSPGTSAWFYYKFGDTTKSGTYRLLVSLSSGVSGTTRNASETIPVTLLDQTSGGAWVHDGVSTTQVNGKRASVVDHATGLTLAALQRTEVNVCDDDENGTVDDEQYGPVKAGGFRMAVPTGQDLDVKLQSAVWAVVPAGFTVATADTDIALGAAETTAPSAPGAVVAEPRNAGAEVSWGAATDDTAAIAYDVYRWTDAPTGGGYTPPPLKVATVTGATSYTDSGLTNGTMYHYLVRAVDAATNVGPRSAIADVTPSDAPTLSLVATPTIVKWGQPWMLSGELKTSSADPVPGATVGLEASVNGGTSWTPVKSLTPEGGTSTYADDIDAPLRKTLYRLVYAGGGGSSAAESNWITVTPKVKLGVPVAPSVVIRSRAFTAYGALTPKQTPGSKTVKIRCYLRRNGAWVLKKTAMATNSTYGSASRYRARFSLAPAGTWKLVASSAATSKYAAATSGAEYLRVK